MRKPIRRVVTGHAAGRSVFITDAPAPHVYNRAPGSAVVTELWETRAMPADNSGNDEVTDHPFRLAPPRNGSVFRIVEYPPDKERLPVLERQRGNSIVRAHSASEDARERADDTRPEPGSTARAAPGGAAARLAKITNQVFLGNINEYYATLGSGQVLRVQTHPLQQFKIGEEVAIEVDATQCSVFRRAMGDTT
jgi:hypothetical protein